MPTSRKFILAVKTWGSDEAIHSWKYLKAHILQVRPSTLLLLLGTLQHTLRDALCSNCMKHVAAIPSLPVARSDVMLAVSRLVFSAACITAACHRRTPRMGECGAMSW
jgi:hypothetical protein